MTNKKQNKQIVDDETELSKYLSTTVNYDKFKDFIKAKHETNEKTKSFYEKLGYASDFERPGYTQNSSCIFLKRSLKTSGKRQNKIGRF